jgi:hypothetical protein
MDFKFSSAISDSEGQISNLAALLVMKKDRILNLAA